MLLFSTPFWAVGIGLAALQAWVPWLMRRTLYVLTNKRALIVQPGLHQWEVEAYILNEDFVLETRVKENGAGDLRFGIDWGEDGPPQVMFLDVPDARLAERKVYEVVASMRQG